MPQPKGPDKTKCLISCTVNGAYFEAEGSKEEVQKKFAEFLNKTLAPLREAIKKAELNK